MDPMGMSRCSEFASFPQGLDGHPLRAWRKRLDKDVTWVYEKLGFVELRETSPLVYGCFQK